MVEQNIVLESTYVLPLFGIEVIISKNFKKEIKKIWKYGVKGYNIYLPSVCLIETIYKLHREYKKSKDLNILKRYSQILPTVITSQIEKIYHSYIDPSASKIAIKIRHASHSDLMDCWIAASAVALNGILLTENVSLKEIMQTIVETKKIKVWTWKSFQENL